jgi:hypothetical protein
MQYILSDMDLTLTTPGERDIFYTTQPLNYRAAEAGVIHDDPLEHSVRLLTELQDHFPNIVLTARSDDCRVDSEKWLNNNGIYPLMVYMRPFGDYTKTSVFKHAMITSIIEKHGRPLVILEDYHKNITAFASFGIPILNPQELRTYEELRKAFIAILISANKDNP